MCSALGKVKSKLDSFRWLCELNIFKPTVRWCSLHRDPECAATNFFLSNLGWIQNRVLHPSIWRESATFSFWHNYKFSNFSKMLCFCLIICICLISLILWIDSHDSKMNQYKQVHCEKSSFHPYIYFLPHILHLTTINCQFFSFLCHYALAQFLHFYSVALIFQFMQHHECVLFWGFILNFNT